MIKNTESHSVSNYKKYSPAEIFGFQVQFGKSQKYILRLRFLVFKYNSVIAFILHDQTNRLSKA